VRGLTSPHRFRGVDPDRCVPGRPSRPLAGVAWSGAPRQGGVPVMRRPAGREPASTRQRRTGRLGGRSATRVTQIGDVGARSPAGRSASTCQLWSAFEAETSRARPQWEAGCGSGKGTGTHQVTGGRPGGAGSSSAHDHVVGRRGPAAAARRRPGPWALGMGGHRAETYAPTMASDPRECHHCPFGEPPRPVLMTGRSVAGAEHGSP